MAWAPFVRPTPVPSFYTVSMPTRDFLLRRNALWQRLRVLPPGTPEFEATVRELSDLTGWDRARVLAGLGLAEPDVRPPSAVA